MAFIGPRPLPPVYMYYFNEEEKHRHDVRPGISGWAQVNGRMDITWEHKLECDLSISEKKEESSEEEELNMRIILYKINDGYVLRFLRKKISKYDFIEKFKIISDLVKKFIE